jgi:hypothetical protein
MNAKSFRITNGVDAIKKRMAEHGTKFGATALQLSFQNSNTSVDLFTSKELTKLSAKFEDPHLEDTYQAHLLAGGRRERSFQFFGAITALVLLLDVCIGLPKMLHQTVDGVTEELAARDDLLLSLLTCRAAVFIPSFAARLLPVSSLSARMVFAIWTLFSIITSAMYFLLSVDSQGRGFYSGEHIYKGGHLEVNATERAHVTNECDEYAADCIPPYFFLTGRWSKAYSFLLLSVVFNTASINLVSSVAISSSHYLFCLLGAFFTGLKGNVYWSDQFFAVSTTTTYYANRFNTLTY